MTLAPGQILNNRYRIVKLLGQGGFGAVYRAWDLQMEGPCAVKENLETSPTAQKQFEREAKLLYKLRHPNLPRVFDHFFVLNQGQYLVMDYIEGEDLGSMLRHTGGPLPETQVIDWIGQVCDALIYLHAQNPPIIHRDIKPANIRITPQGQAILVDFGIAKLYDPSTKTTTGARAVTPGYSPPEQFGLGSTDAQSDVYAMGATIYHLLTGHAPPAAMDIMAGSSAPPRPIHLVNPIISPQVSVVVEKAMKPNRSERLGSVAEFKTALSMSRGFTPSQPVAPSLVTPTIQSPPDREAYALTGPETASQAVSAPMSAFRKLSPKILWTSGLVLAGLFLVGMLAFGLTLGQKLLRQEATPISRLTPLALTTSEGEFTQEPGSSSPPLAGSPAPSLSGTQAPTLLDTPLALPREPISLDNANRVVPLARWGKGFLEEVAWSPDGDILALASSTGIYFYDPKTITEQRWIETNYPMESLAFSPDGQLLATRMTGGIAQLWRLSDGSPLYQFKDTFSNLAFSPDGEMLAFGSSESGTSEPTVVIVRASDGSPIHTLKEGGKAGNYVSSVVFSPEGKVLASAYHSGEVKLWLIADGSLLRKIDVGEEGYAPELAISPDGNILACLAGYTFSLWKISDGSKLYRHEKEAGLYSLAFSPDGKILATGSSDGTVSLWGVPDMSLIRTLSDSNNPINYYNIHSIAFSPNGTELAAVSWDNILRLWSVSDGEQLAANEDFNVFGSPAFSPDNTQLAFISYIKDHFAQIRRVVDGSLLRTISVQDSNINRVAFSPDGDFLATDGSINTFLWRVSDGSLSKTLQGQELGSGCLAFSPDGMTLAAGSPDKNVYLFDLSQTPSEITPSLKLEGHSDSVQEVAFSPDGKLLASASWDKTVRLWNVSDGTSLQVLTGHAAKVDSVVFSPNGETLASGAPYESVKLWRVSDGKLLASYEEPSFGVTDLAFSTDGSILAVAANNGEIQLLRASDGSLLIMLKGSSYSYKSITVPQLVFSSDGLLLAYNSPDGTVRIWGVKGF